MQSIQKWQNPARMVRGTVNKNPWHKRYHGDALHGYRGLTLEQRGAYGTILDLLYDCGEEGLADNERLLSGHLDVSVRKWRVLRGELISAGKIHLLADGRISNFRYRKEREKSLEISRKRVESGAKGGRAKAEQGELLNESNDPTLANAKALAKQKPLYARAYQKLEARRESTDVDSRLVESPQTPLAEDLAKELAKLGGISLSGNAAYVSAYSEVQAWLDAGIEPSTMRTAVVAFTAKARTPSRSLHRFDGDVRLHHARAPKARSAKAREIDAPVTLPDDPDPRIADLRSTLRNAVGPRTYDGWLRGSAFTLNGTGLIVTCPSTFMADWTESHLARELASAAQQHGLGSVKITTIPLKG